MSQALSFAELIDRFAPSLSLDVVHMDREHAPRLEMRPALAGRTGPAPLIGHLNVVQPNRIQVFGPAELGWWANRDRTGRTGLLRQLFVDDLAGIIVTDNQAVPDDIVRAARRTGTPLVRSTQACEHVIATLRHSLTRELAERITLHGVFLDVHGTGVLLTGDAAVGKSELALELISRGHSLVADDAPEFSRPAPDAIEGESTPVLQDFLEVRGLGILNVRSMYGDAAIRHRKRLQLVIHLELLTSGLCDQVDRLNGNLVSREILGLSVPLMTLPVAPGRNLAVMVEAAVRSFLLLRRGYSAADDLMARQKEAMQGGPSCA